jgi:hypothetical protein
VTFFSQVTEEEYVKARTFREIGEGVFREFHPGDRASYAFHGKSTARAVFVEVFYGLTGWWDLGLQVPYFYQSFSDDQDVFFPSKRQKTGISDVRAFTKYRLMLHPLVAAISVGVKIPTGKFEVDQNLEGIISVGEGQWDIDLIVHAGRSFWPVPLYLNADIGYRIRRENRTILRDPGDEWIFTGEVGGTLHPRIQGMVKLDGLRGESAIIYGVDVASDVREILYLAPTLVLKSFTGGPIIEGGARFSLVGKNFPAGVQFVVGASYTYRL